METNEKNKGLDMVEVEAGYLTCLITSLNTLLNGVSLKCCCNSLNGVLSGGDNDAMYQKRLENSMNWMIDNYETVSGAIRVASDITEILSDVVIDYNVTVKK